MVVNDGFSGVSSRSAMVVGGISDVGTGVLVGVASTGSLCGPSVDGLGKRTAGVGDDVAA